MIKKIIWNGILLITFFFFSGGIRSEAEELSLSFTLSTGGDGASMKDGSHNTSVSFHKDSTITITSDDGVPFTQLYIIWDSPVVEWTLHTDQEDILCGQNGFLHEYIALNSPASSAVIHIPMDNTRISDIRIFSEGVLPEDVQIWNPPCEKADIMLIPAHADDEILFFGGIIPKYGAAGEAEIQVAYMTEFWNTNRVREHEKLDGLWASGLKNYPVCGGFKDVYSESLETALGQYSFDDTVRFVTEQIRRFQPQVIVTHDQNGEYGHGFHMLTSKAVTTAVEAALDHNQYSNSAELYGIWDTPKTYIHLYGENKIRLDLRQPIESMGGRTALEIAADAYKKHVSQQWCWFYVSDDYEYSCADFGLYRTTVGNDALGDDIFENLKTYKAQRQEEEERQAAELERIQELERQRLEQEEKEAQEKLEQERLAKEQQLEEQQRLQREKEALQRQEYELKLQQEKQNRLYNFVLVLLILAGISLTIVIIIWTRMIIKRSKRRK